MKTLTQRQRQILEFIKSYCSEHGFMPSQREIGEACGLRSVSSVSRQIRNLVELNELSRVAVGQRSIQITNKVSLDKLLLATEQDFEEAVAAERERIIKLLEDDRVFAGWDEHGAALISRFSLIALIKGESSDNSEVRTSADSAVNDTKGENK